MLKIAIYKRKREMESSSPRERWEKTGFKGWISEQKGHKDWIFERVQWRNLDFLWPIGRSYTGLGNGVYWVFCCEVVFLQKITSRSVLRSKLTREVLCDLFTIGFGASKLFPTFSAQFASSFLHIHTKSLKSLKSSHNHPFHQNQIEFHHLHHYSIVSHCLNNASLIL